MNWGTKIVIGMALFMTFILAMAVKMVIDGGQDDLVEKDYYEKGLDYDKEYDLQTVALTDSVIPQFTTSQEGLLILFKAPVQYTLGCRRASDSKLDRVYQGESDSENQVFISRTDLKSGPWNLHLKFTVKGKEYVVAREITMP
jgi:hypothetical protein